MMYSGHQMQGAYLTVPLPCRYVQAELVHSRFAMAAVAGILIPEVMQHISAHFFALRCSS